MPTREIARRTGTAPSTVELTIRRFDAAGLSWPLSDDITDTEPEARLFAGAGADSGTQRGHRGRPCGLGFGAPRAQAQARDAFDPVGGTRRYFDRNRKQLTVVGKRNKMRVLDLEDGDEDFGFRLFSNLPAAIETSALFWHRPPPSEILVDGILARSSGGFS
jgi:hypothetical protein